jgi:glycyl-tRNA synthetase beta chain
MADFLLELGLEEVPDRYLPGLRAGLHKQLLAALESAGVKADAGAARAYGGPRRLAVFIPGLPEKLADEMKKGPPVQQAFTADGKPTPAAEGFAKKLGLSVADLKKSDDGKFLMGFQPGCKVLTALPQAITTAVNKLDLPKCMRWGTGEHEFVRPLRWLVALFDDAVVPATLFGITASNHSQGPRLYDAASGKTSGEPVLIKHPGEYISALEATGILPAPSHRREKILRLLEHAARDAGGVLQPDEELLDKVADLVETPGVIAGKFDEAFLKMPAEILVTAMREHQKNFAVTDSAGKLLPLFLAVIDKPADPAGFIRRGNEAVLKSRLDDAKFFYEEDLKLGLDAMREKTKEINFYAGLGSYYDKSERLINLCQWINQAGIEPEAVKIAATYAKSDLASNLVGEKEFVGLQGLAGCFYVQARADFSAMNKLHSAPAIAHQYGVGNTGEAVTHILGLSDRLDSLTGFFMMGKAPTGSKDPFALRRAGNQFWQIYFQQSQGSFSLREMLQAAAEFHAPALKKSAAPDWQTALEKFFGERLENYFLELGYSKPEIQSVLRVRTDLFTGNNGPNNALFRLKALREMRDSATFAGLTETMKRVSNILQQQTIPPDYDVGLFGPPAEHELEQQYRSVRTELSQALAKAEFTSAFASLAKLREPMDRYFAKESNVMVMTDDPKLRANRLAFLGAVSRLFDQLFDPAILAGEARK